MSDPLGLDTWWNPFSWSGKTWAVVGTVAVVVGAIALAATGVGLIADAALVGTAAVVEAGTVAATVASVAEVAGTVGTVAGFTAAGLDGGMCVFHHDGAACAGAIFGAVGGGFGAIGGRLAEMGARDLAVGVEAHAFGYGAGATTIDGVNYASAQAEDFRQACDEFKASLRT
jgi:hypothetical protein